MTALVVHPADRSGPGRPVAPADIPGTLSAAGVLLARWPLRAGDPLTAYAAEISALQDSYGLTAVDVVAVRPDTPGHAAMRAKFLAEHTHDDFEVRFFAAGSGTFYLHLGKDVLVLRCEAGDLISVPAGMCHWFDMGDEPSFTAIRLFTRPDGWVATFTGDDLALHFPPHAAAP